MYEKYTVLFVDDERYILNSLRRGFADETFECIFAESGQEALDILEAKEVHVIVCDMKMPGVTGLELLKIISEKWPDIVKVVLSGYTQLPQILVTINQVDIFKFVTKPWVLEELITSVKKSLDFYIVQEENRDYQKLLEKKNQSYQDILNQVEEVVQEARKSSEIMGLCGKSIFAFERKYDMKDRIRFQGIFSMGEEIFKILSHAMMDQKKTYKLSEIDEEINMLMQEKISNVSISNSKAGGMKNYELSLEVLKSAIEIMLHVFKSEFAEYGIVYSLQTDNGFKLSVICPKVVDEVSNELTKMDVKIAMVKNILQNDLFADLLKFQIAVLEGNLVIGVVLVEKDG